jgi:large subunit ribosomal protein L22
VPEAKKTRVNPRAAKDEAAQEAAEVKAEVAAEQADEAAEASAEEAEADEAAAEAEAETPAKPRRTRRKTEEPVAAAKAAPKKKKAAPTGPPPVVHAHAKYVRTSARKARLVCDHIRGKSVTEARAILAHTPRAVAEDWQKLLESAVANAEHNHELIGDELRIMTVKADEGPTLKRFRPRAMGRASKIRKRTSHLSIALTPKE